MYWKVFLPVLLEYQGCSFPICSFSLLFLLCHEEGTRFLLSLQRAVTLQFISVSNYAVCQFKAELINILHKKESHV